MTQETLFHPDVLQPQAPPPRPSRHSEEVRKATARALLPAVRRWFGDAAADYDEANMLRDLESALRGEDDAYRMAKRLEYSGWESDAELVDVLEAAGSHEYRVHRDLVKAWVTANNIQAPFPVGTLVSFERDGERVTGEVTVIHADEATYTVFCAALGHVREGVGTHGFILPYEAVSPAGAVPSTESTSERQS